MPGQSKEGGGMMRTERIVLAIGKADGTIVEVPMRYNRSHQRGYRCFIGPLADQPEAIGDDTARSFEGRSLFDALAEYRRSIEPGGWRLLHAAARRDCWPKPGELDPVVRRWIPGVEQTLRVDAFEPAVFGEVTTLERQRKAFGQWKKGLAPVHEGRVRPRAGHEHDTPVVDSGPLARLAGRILRKKDE
jgi:hypothetical protein